MSHKKIQICRMKVRMTVNRCESTLLGGGRTLRHTPSSVGVGSSAYGVTARSVGIVSRPDAGTRVVRQIRLEWVWSQQHSGCDVSHPATSLQCARMGRQGRWTTLPAG